MTTRKALPQRRSVHVFPGGLGGETVKNASLPSSEAAASFLNGEDGGFAKIISSTLLRALLIAPGLALGGVREPKKVIIASLASSLMISTFILVYLGAKATSQPTSALVLAGRRRPVRSKMLTARAQRR